jgi:hypothetical protein
MDNDTILTVEIVKGALQDVVSPDHKWPVQPAGWQLEFIVYPDGEVVMDFLHPVSCMFWSEDNEPLETPLRQDKTVLTWKDLKAAGIPFMTTFGHAAVTTEAPEPHLKLVKQ